MEEVIFIPRYERRLKVAFAICTVMVIGSWVMVLRDPGSISGDLDLLVALILFSILVPAFPSLIPRRIHFGSEMTIDYYAFRKKSIRYDEITDVTGWGVYTRRGNIPFKNLINADELTALLEQKIEEGALDARQLTGDAFRKEYVALKATLPSVLLTVVIAGALAYAGTPFAVKYPMLTLLGIFIVLYTAFYFIYKLKEEYA